MGKKREADAFNKLDVIVIGGGIAGLAAARELAGRGLNTILLEASYRLGGRIHTVHHQKLPVELGAEFIHGKSNALLQAISDAGLEKQPAVLKTHFCSKGVLKQFNFWDEIGRVISAINPRHPDISFEQFLRLSRLPRHEREHARGFVQGFDAADPKFISSHSLLRAEYSSDHMHGSWQGRVVRGYGALVGFLARDFEDLNGIIAMGEAARELTWAENNVEVKVRRGQKTVSYHARAAVIALPLGILKTEKLYFHPALPEKEEAIRELEMGRVIKVTMVFRNRWWPATGFVHAFKESFPTIWDDPRGPALTAWAGGPKAEALKNLPRATLEKAALKVVAKVFSASTGTVRKNLAASYFHDWARDPFVCGAYSYIPVNGMVLPKLLAEPAHDTLFFAGEATVSDAQTGTVFGALESGIRAAREIWVRKQ